MKTEVFQQIEKLYRIDRKNILTVSEVSQYIQNSLSNDPKLNQIYVLGEVTNASEKQGHVYFDIKDEEALLRCIIFAGTNKKLSFKVENGLEILIFGSISTYKKRGLYQLVTSAVFPIGEGAFYLQFKQLKEKLSKEGMFDEQHKKQIPTLPKTIGLITSKTSAACKDVLQILKNRFPNVTVKLINTLTQGAKASKEISNAIHVLNLVRSVDVIILVRGGGSIEDLMCFNDEQLARVIFTSQTPIITGIGHETDYTIADFVADKRAATPSVAAKLAIIDKKDIIEEINTVRNELRKSYDNFTTSKLKDKKLKRYKIVTIVLIILMILFIAYVLLVGF